MESTWSSEWLTQPPLELQQAELLQTEEPEEVLEPRLRPKTSLAPSTRARRPSASQRPAERPSQRPAAPASQRPVAAPSQRSAAPPSQRPAASDGAAQAAAQLEQALSTLATLPSVRYVVMEAQRPAAIQSEWPTLYDHYVDVFNIDTPLPTVQRFADLLTAMRGNADALQLLQVQAIDTLQELSAALEAALAGARGPSAWLGRLLGRDAQDTDALALALSTAQSAQAQLCRGEQLGAAQLEPTACRLQRRPRF